MVSFRRTKNPLYENPIKVFEVEQKSRSKSSTTAETEGIEVFKRSVLLQNTQQHDSNQFPTRILQIHAPTFKYDGVSEEKDIEVIHRQTGRQFHDSSHTKVRVVSQEAAFSPNTPVEERTLVSYKQQKKKRLLRTLICGRPSDLEGELEEEPCEGTIASILEDEDDPNGMSVRDLFDEEKPERLINLKVLQALLEEREVMKQKIQNVQQEARDIEQSNFEAQQTDESLVPKGENSASTNILENDNDMNTIKSIVQEKNDPEDAIAVSYNAPKISSDSLAPVNQATSCGWDCGASDATSTVVSGCSSIVSLDLSLDFLDELGCALKESFVNVNSSFENLECYGCATPQATILQEDESAFVKPVEAKE